MSTACNGGMGLRGVTALSNHHSIISSFHQPDPCTPDWLILLIYISITSIISTLLAGVLWVTGSGRMWLSVSGGEGSLACWRCFRNVWKCNTSSLETSTVMLSIIIMHKICCRYKMLSASECIQYTGTKMTWFPAVKCWKRPDSCPCWTKGRNLKSSLSHTLIKLICQFLGKLNFISHHCSRVGHSDSHIQLRDSGNGCGDALQERWCNSRHVGSTSAPSGLPALFPRDKDTENSLHILRQTDGRAGEINVETEAVNRTDNTSCNEKLRKGHDSANSCLDDPITVWDHIPPLNYLSLGMKDWSL